MLLYLTKYNVRKVLYFGIFIFTISTLFFFVYLNNFTMSVPQLHTDAAANELPPQYEREPLKKIITVDENGLTGNGGKSPHHTFPVPLDTPIVLEPAANNTVFEPLKNERMQITSSAHITSISRESSGSSTDGILSELKEAMRYSWKAYTDNAWGKDEALILSKSGTIWMNASLTMIDALDTLWLYGMKTEFNAARDWIKDNVNFDYDNNRISVFESTIRLLGGLQSAFHFSNDSVFQQKAELLGSKLLAAFDNPSGLPMPDINFFNNHTSYPSSLMTVSLAEVGTVQLEFNDLAIVLSKLKVAIPAANVYKALKRIPHSDGLLPANINPSKLTARSPTYITLGARSDSYYEYLVKIWVQLGKPDNFLKQDYIEAIDSIQARLIRHTVPNNLTFIGELSNERFSPKMDHLACFLSGTLAYGFLHGMPQEHLSLAKELARTCFAMYNQTATGLSPEIVYFNLANRDKNDFYIKHNDAHNILRPEFVESLFYLYQITKDNIYREWGRQIFKAFQKYSRFSKGGYTSIADVTQTDNIKRRDKMESFWLAETLKYFLLLFSDEAASKVDLRNWVFNTEAHPFPIPQPSEILANLTEAYNRILS